jgi:hypothetical protein
MTSGTEFTEYGRACLEASIAWFRGRRDGKFRNISRHDYIECVADGKGGE